MKPDCLTGIKEKINSPRRGNSEFGIRNSEPFDFLLRSTKSSPGFHRFVPFVFFVAGRFCLSSILIGLIVLVTAESQATALTPPQRVRVTGRVELLNSKVKRNGRVDARGVVVWLEPLDGGGVRGVRGRQKIIQTGKRFIPHVLVVERGAEVDFPNLDPFFHNVFSLYEGKRFDLGLYASGETRPVLFNRAGVSYIFCNIHPQMSAIVVTLDTPYFTLTDQEGAFTISEVPEGRYQLRVWHERTSEPQLQAQSRVVRLGGASFDAGVMQLSEAGYLPRPHQNKHGESYDNERNKPAYRRP
jgi:plastocyanin